MQPTSDVEERHLYNTRLVFKEAFSENHICAKTYMGLTKYDIAFLLCLLIYFHFCTAQHSKTKRIKMYKK